MNATDTRPAPQHADGLAASRAFPTALAITLGILTALVATVALFFLTFGPNGGVILESDGVVEEVVVEPSSSQGTDAAAANPVSARPDPWWMSGQDCAADACTMLTPRSRTA